MKTTSKLAVLLSLSAALLGAAQAQTATPRVDQREANQQARIAEGAASGQLTSKETQRLEREQARIQTAEAKAKSDGTVTAKERGKLHVMQDAASKDIHHLKHNKRKAPGATQ